MRQTLPVYKVAIQHWHFLLWKPN